MVTVDGALARKGWPVGPGRLTLAKAAGRPLTKSDLAELAE